MNRESILTPELIEGFVTSLLLKNFDNPVAVPEFHRELWELLCSDHRKVAIAAPRSFAKSTAVTHAYTLACVLFREARHVLIVADTESQACAFLGNIKNELSNNEELRDTFKVGSFVRDREADVICSFQDGATFRILAKGAEQKLRGTSWENTRPELIIGDDLENDEQVMSDDRRLKMRRWFYNALLPSGSRYCKVRVVGTVLHMDSLLERLMPKMTDKDTRSTPLKDYSEDTTRIWRSVRYRAHNQDFSHLLWKDHMPQKALEAIRRDYVDQGMPDGYSGEYLNVPIDEENAYFKLEDFHDIPPEAQNVVEDVYIGVDMAISKSDRAAYTVFAVAGIDDTHMMRVREIVRFRGDALDILEMFFELNARYKPQTFFVEKENIARTLGPVLDREMMERDTFFDITPMIATQDKVRRARGLQARMRAGAVQFAMGAEWFPDLQTEMVQFPRGVYMDQVDGLAWIPLGLESIPEGPSDQELKDQAYNDEFGDNVVDFYGYNEGRSQITGY